MKNILFSLVTIIAILSTQNLSADEITGEKIYAKKLKSFCGFKGDEFAKKFTQKEWDNIYKNHKLNSILQEFCPKSEPLKEEYLQHLYQFFHKYATDSGKKPLC